MAGRSEVGQIKERVAEAYAHALRRASGMLLLCNAGSSQLCVLEGWDEGVEVGGRLKREKGYMCIYMADSRCCTAESNTTL